MKTRVTELFGIEYPVLMGAMMWLAKPDLCAAVSNAGGLGNLTAGNFSSGEDLRNAINRTRELTDKPFCVNLTLLPSVRLSKELHEDYFRVCCEEKVNSIDVSGAPLDRYFGPEAIARAKEAGIKLIHKVGAVRHAVHAEHVGYDCIIAAGFEEGGHPLGDDVTTMLLTPRIVDSVRIPVVTAGGIADGRGMAAAFVLGAEGVMMASRFIATPECGVHDNIRRELVRRYENDTVMILKTLDLQMRALRNEVVGKVAEVEARGGGLQELLPLIGGGLQEVAWETGDVDSAPLPVGQSIGLIDRVMTCEEIITSIVKEAGEILTTVQRRFV